MFFLNFIEFLYYHVKLLGKRRGTAWDKGWDGYLYAIFPMAMMYLSFFLLLIEAFWGESIPPRSLLRTIQYFVVPPCVAIALGIYYWRNDEKIMKKWAEKSANNKWLRLPSYLVLYTYYFVGFGLLLLSIHLVDVYRE